MTSTPSPAVGRRAAIVAAVLHLGFSILVQAEDFVLYIREPADGWRSAFAFAAQLPFRQLEHILFAVALGSLAMPMSRWRIGRAAYVTVFSLSLLYLVVDQIAFPTFGGHFELALVDGVSLRDARDSILADIPSTLVPNLVTWIGAVGVMAWAMWRRPASASRVPNVPPRHRHMSRAVAAGVLLFATASIALMAATPASPLDRAAIPVLVRSAFSGEFSHGGRVVADPDLYRLRFGTATAEIETSALDDTFHGIRRAVPNPNIVFVILESVGAEQLFGNGGLSPRVTPTLAGLADRMVSFDALYNTFPGSMRGQLPINTGGRTVTWNNFSGPVVDQYQGPVLVRELKKIGYRTALVSAQSLALENMGAFYASLDFDYFYQPELEPDAVRASREVHSWGVDEDLTRQRAVEWIDRGNAREPFFLQLLTVSTHHPYAGPKEYVGPLSGSDNRTRYYNALSYVDQVLGRLMTDLDRRGLLDNTLIVVTGDHGQAFGDLHKGNFYHQNHLYEENIRNFLAVVGPPVVTHGLRVSRAGTTGDIMPTILSLAHGDPGDAPGQNLFDPGYRQRLVFFHKATTPRLWGLRDGRWKFTSRMTGTGAAELYDLETDPREQRNLASQYPRRIDAYQRACQQWYVETDQDYTARVAGYRAADLTKADLLEPGPKRLAFGSMGDDGEFRELPSINPREDVVVWTRWVPWSEDKRLFYRWRAPDGRQTSFSVLAKGAWGESWVHSEIIEPMEAGTWQLTIADLEGELMSGTFQVSEQAPLLVAMDPTATEPRTRTGRR